MSKKILFFLLFITNSYLLSAEIYPLTLQSRVQESQSIVMGKVVQTISYWDQDHKNIYTLHDIEIDGFYKGQHNTTHIGLIDLGGEVGNQKQETFPAVHMAIGDYGLFMLSGAAPSAICAPGYRTGNTNYIQAFATASVQGVLTYTSGTWHDVSNPETTLSTDYLLGKLKEYTGNDFRSAQGQRINPSTLLVNNFIHSSNKTLAVTTLQNGSLAVTNTFNSGVSNNASMEMIINGSGFGATAGTINFPNANAGGGTNTFTFPTSTAGLQSLFGAPTDIISWSNSQIRIRVPRGAGTGNMEVFNSSNVSQGTAAITIDWSIIPVYSDFSSFASPTSQFGLLIDDNNAGGYTFQMSTAGSATFFGNAQAKEALRRAMNTWRCGTSINWDLDLDAGSSAGFASDGINIVMFDNSLPTGVLGRCTSRFGASANGSCSQYNTFWRINEVDMQFQTIPSAGFTWNYNSSGTASNQFSFETVALHELGHGHGMGHVVDNAKVMHYASSNGTQVVTLAPSDIAAGIYKVTASAGPNCITSPGPMTALGNPCTPLPIDLLRFDAYTKGSDNIVEWETANELDIQGYEVQRSLNGNDFMTLGKVPAAIDQSENLYAYSHQNPISSVNYYRLKINDQSAKTSYSRVIKLVREDRSQYSVFPNPTTGALTLMLSGLGSGFNHISYNIADTKGSILTKSHQLISSKEAELQLNLESFSTGIYFMHLSINGKSYTQKIVKE